MTDDRGLDARVPVIVAIGEIVDRPIVPAQGREPVALMADALRAADADGGGGLLARLDSIDVVGQITWRYRDPVGLLCDRLGIAPARRVNASMGGETPIRLIHEAALRVIDGGTSVAAIVGGEALNSLAKLHRTGAVPAWTPAATIQETIRVPFDRLPVSPCARLAGATDPVHIYPFYENAVARARGHTPAQAQRANAQLWAGYARIAAGNPFAWIRTAPDPDKIGTPSCANRMIAFPYPKLMVANPMVNQAAAVIVTSLQRARAAGVAEHLIIHLWGGAAAEEPADFMKRDRYDRSTAQQAVLAAAIAIAGRDANAVDLVELYSCFPVVPQMALDTLAALGAARGLSPTVTGGLTFFGGPLNNYMTHATCAMVRKLRTSVGRVGLLYGQGGVMSKHHALVVSTAAPPRPLAKSYSDQDVADFERGTVPPMAEAYRGQATIETYTVLYDPQGRPKHGIVIARTSAGERLIAKVAGDDVKSMARLLDTNSSAIETLGNVRVGADGGMHWEADAVGCAATDG